MKRLICMVMLPLILSGCKLTSPTMEGYYSEKVNPDYTIKTDMHVLVHPSGISTDDELAIKFNIQNVVKALNLKGFKNVYTTKSLQDKNLKIDIDIYVGLTSQSESYEYSSADYGMVDSGVINTGCTTIGYTTNCTSINTKSVGVTGYSTKNSSYTGRYISMYWYDSYSGELISSIYGATFEKCTEQGAYEFIIDETIQRAQFSTPREYSYKVKMQDNYTCEY